MVRSMYSGVAGMKTHQTRMDVIGNNIANVNTYGFKSSRATFRDVYYQTMRGASQGTGNTGGMNPTQVGYGSQLGSIDTLMTQSVMSTTGNPLDVAITGEGFFQVQDSDGNIFYTKAGMLDIDSNGNMVDLNGNFVLGVAGSPIGKAPGKDRIQFTLPTVNPAAATANETINGVNVVISAQNQTADGNVTFNFGADNSMPIGQKAKAVVTTSGISISLNAKEKFANAGELQTEINRAITEANGGKEHPAGTFTISINPATKFPAGGLTGAEICGSNFGYNKGTLPVGNNSTAKLFGGFTVATVGNGFTGNTSPTYTLVNTPADATTTPPTEESFLLSCTVGGKTYSKSILASQMATAGSVVLSVADGAADDTITMNFPPYASVIANATNPTGPPPYIFAPVTITEQATPSTPSNDLGLNRPIKLKDGTKGGPLSVKDLTGISIGADGVVVASHSSFPGGRMEIGRIDLATFDNPAGLEQAGNTYFLETSNSGKPVQAQPGSNGAGALKSSALETSNVDLSQEFSDMITTQRGFQANSRLITVSDTMLEELINLKR